MYVSLKSAKRFWSYCGLMFRQGILAEVGNYRFLTFRTPISAENDVTVDQQLSIISCLSLFGAKTT